MEYVAQRIINVENKSIKAEEESTMKKDKNKECGQKYKIKLLKSISNINQFYVIVLR